MERYLVFARTDYAEPLSFQTMLEVPTGADAQQQVLDTVGAHWLELVLIPETEAYPAIEEAAPRAMETRA